MSRLNLPPGCRSIRMEDGTRYVAAREGGHVEVADQHVSLINGMRGNGEGGLLNAGFRDFGVTTKGKSGRWCQQCRRLWYAWAKVCPRCGTDTVPE